jgi:hypothetical protein
LWYIQPTAHIKKFTNKPEDPRVAKPITNLIMYLMDEMSASSILDAKSEA